MPSSSPARGRLLTCPGAEPIKAAISPRCPPPGCTLGNSAGPSSPSGSASVPAGCLPPWGAAAPEGPSSSSSGLGGMTGSWSGGSFARSHSYAALCAARKDDDLSNMRLASCSTCVCTRQAADWQDSYTEEVKVAIMLEEVTVCHVSITPLCRLVNLHPTCNHDRSPYVYNYKLHHSPLPSPSIPPFTSRRAPAQSTSTKQCSSTPSSSSCPISSRIDRTTFKGERAEEGGAQTSREG